MVEIVKAILASHYGWVFLLAALVVVAALGSIFLRIIRQEIQKGSRVRIFGIWISPKPVPERPAEDGEMGPGKTSLSEKTVYVKLLHLREKKDSGKPVYTHTFGDGQKCEVWDEAVYMFFQSFPKEQKSFRWNIRSSGIAYPNLLHPWMDKLNFPDHGEPPHGPVVAPICYIPSNLYIPISHLFNGQQPGNREVLLLAESELGRARLVLDASSVAGMKLTHVEAIRSTASGQHEAIGRSEPRPGVFTCQAVDMKPGDTLRFTYDVEPR